MVPDRARWTRCLPRAALGLALALGAAAGTHATDVLFIGNSFTFGYGSAVRTWRAETVEDLNGDGFGGVPALFKAFTRQAGLRWTVALETQGGVGLDWHLANRRDTLVQRRWDVVVMHGYSTLDAARPGDPALLLDSAKRMAALLAGRNPAVDVRLLATWPRADQVYPPQGAWHGRTLAAMGRDLREAYAQAATAAGPAVKGVIPVGDAWLRAIATGIADPDPYDGIGPGQLDLWAHDHYHASAHGSYLEALVVFGALTGRDPRTLGRGECAGFELGLSMDQVAALQQVAFDELAERRMVTPAPPKPEAAASPAHCPRGH